MFAVSLTPSAYTERRAGSALAVDAVTSNDYL
jgi:hypothetical protein